MNITCARCGAKNELGEGAEREDSFCHSCYAPLTAEFEKQIADNERLSGKPMKWKTDGR